jgi:hypothetical protein
MLPERAVVVIFAQTLSFCRFRVKGLITAVALATAADIALTYIGLRHGYLIELNPLMDYVLKSGQLRIVLTLYLALLFALLYRYAEMVRWLGSAMFAVLVLKAAILFQHLAILIRVALGY